MLKLTLRTLEDTFSADVETIDEACETVQAFIDELWLGSNTFGGADLFDEDGKYLGWISFNCRFWPERGVDHE